MMPNGETKPGNASADRWRELFEQRRKEADAAVTRLEVRADMKSFGEEEISEVIEQRSLEAQRKKESEPPSGVAKGFFGIAKGMKSDWAKVASLAILVGFLLASAYLALK